MLLALKTEEGPAAGASRSWWMGDQRPLESEEAVQPGSPPFGLTERRLLTHRTVQ